jgi:hypothetical protein
VTHEHDSISPLTDLRKSDRGIHRDHGASYRRQNAAASDWSGDDRGNQPGDGDVETEIRKVNVTVGSLLQTDLDQSDHRDECAEKPEPTHEHEGPAPHRRDCENSNCSEHRDGQGHRSPLDSQSGMRVEDRKAARQQAFFQVGAIGRNRIEGANREGHVGERTRGMSSRLSPERHRTKGGTDNK